MRLTLKDVAGKASVSVSTACRALNNSFGTNDDTRRRVAKVAAHLNYRTAIADNLAGGDRRVQKIA
ncbi:MAG: LacI family DNA-binding transcriptional regulator [Acidobacteriaceae bacterium]